jgi:threonine/homoserine/homoserine lactone efflux protein
VIIAGLIFIGTTSFIIALSGALVPGPLFGITVVESARRGFIAGPLIILGHGILELLMVTLLLMGVSPLLTSPASRLAISIIGGLILMYMGYQMIRDAARARLETSAEAGHRQINLIILGIIGSVSNPYWTIWWITIGLGYVISSMKFGTPGVIAFFAGHILADLLWYCIISLTVSKGKKLIGDRGYRVLFYACGVFLILFGMWFVKGV